MSCLICKSSEHDVFDCTSNHAQTMDEATNHWIKNRLILLYSTNSSCEDIHFISTQYQFTRLNKGDLLYLNREWMQDDPMWNLPILIYTFLAHKTLEVYDECVYENIHGFSDMAINIMRIDANYWSMLTLPHITSIEYAKNIRKELVHAEALKHTPILYTESSIEIDLSIYCSVCLTDGYKPSECHQYNCLHYFCKGCSNNIVLKNPALCPLCRTKITKIQCFVF